MDCIQKDTTFTSYKNGVYIYSIRVSEKRVYSYSSNFIPYNIPKFFDLFAFYNTHISVQTVRCTAPNRCGVGSNPTGCATSEGVPVSRCDALFSTSACVMYTGYVIAARVIGITGGFFKNFSRPDFRNKMLAAFFSLVTC